MAKKPEDAALWRYGIISPLLHREAGGIPLCKELESLSKKTFLQPDGTQRRLSGETLREWLYRYRQGGVESLSDKTRCDRGTTQVPLPFQERLRKERGEHPEWTLKRILLALRQEGFWNGGTPSKSALYRFAKAARLGRDTTPHPLPLRPFSFERFGEMWMADFLHGPKIKQGRKRLKTYLLCILDDASRYVVSVRCHLAEDTCALISDLMEAIRRFGCPRYFYTDNGAAFKSNHLLHVGARLGIQMPHTPAYVPQGRGKVERWFRSLRDGCLAGYQPLTLEELSGKLSEWTSDYHHRIHSALGETPLERRLSIESVLRPLADMADIESLFRMEEKKRVLRNGCIRLFGRLFEVKGALPGERLKVSFLPWQKDRVFYVAAEAAKGTPLAQAHPVNLSRNAHRFASRPFRGKGER